MTVSEIFHLGNMLCWLDRPLTAKSRHHAHYFTYAMPFRESINGDWRATVATNVLALFAIALFATGCSERNSTESATRSADTASRSHRAYDLFKRRCSTAGETIKRTVKDVDGIFLLKVRPNESNFNRQFDRDDPYGHDIGGDAYIESFLNAKYEERKRFAASFKEYPASLNAPFGYAFVEAISPHDQKLYRYTAHLEQPWQTDRRYSKNHWIVVLDKLPALKARARYGVTFDDISTDEDRALWIAGSSLKVIDLKTKDVIAERIGYMIDPGQGSTGSGGGRSPWLIAASTACPAFPGRPGFVGQRGQTIRFVEKVLIPAQGL